VQKRENLLLKKKKSSKPEDIRKKKSSKTENTFSPSFFFLSCLRAARNIVLHPPGEKEILVSKK
jgi:hypothetical protein